MEKETKTVNLGFLGTLFLVFLILKLTNNITWSWWWVTSPLWSPFAIVIVGAITIFIFQRIFKR